MRVGERVLDRFEVERWAASGGMADVYRARDVATGERVALKLFRGGSPTSAERFVREAAIVATMSDPRIVRYVAHGALASGELCLVTEWLEGFTLAALMTRRQLAWDEALRLGYEAARALSAAHARGLVHRDVTPRNLFVLRSGPPMLKVLDFGLVRVLDATFVLTKTGAVMGTPGYLSPEQVAGERDLDPRTDVFALGCVLYEALAARPAFAGEDAVALLRRTLFEDPAPLADLATGAPPEARALVERMLAKERDARPKDGAEVASALRAILSRAAG